MWDAGVRALANCVGEERGGRDGERREMQVKPSGVVECSGGDI